MDETHIRRLFLSDDEWNRTSASWKQLKPKRNYNQFDPADESVAECTIRLQTLGYPIPLQVVDQWLYPHYYNDNMVNNYGWIDYNSVEFAEAELPLEKLVSVYVIEEFRDYVEMRAQSNVFGDFMCLEIDLEHWKSQLTWRIPPIVLDTKTLMTAPKYAEISTGLQLVEGHTRLGYLLAMKNAAHPLQEKHRVFILRAKMPTI